MPVNEEIRRLLFKIKPFLANAKIADAEDVEIDSSGFDGNLSTDIQDVQGLAEALDNLTVTASGVSSSFGALRVDIAPRVNVGASIGGNRVINYRIYNHSGVTALNLFVDQGGTFSTHALTVPDGEGEQTQTVDIGTVLTTADTTIIFYLVGRLGERFMVAGAYVVHVDTIEADEVDVDNDDLTNITVNNVQDVANALNALQGVVNDINSGTRTRLGAITPFTTSVTVGTNEFENYDNEIGLYVRQTDARVNFNLPTEAVINGRYPVTITILNQAGTGRFTTGFTPTNTVVIQAQGSDQLRRTSATGTLLTFQEAHRNDLVVVTKSAAGQPWVTTRSTLSTGALLLPDGIFNLHQDVTARILPDERIILTGGTPSFNPAAGDAFRVTNDSPTVFNGRGVQENDVIVAITDNPNRLADENNDDWVIIRGVNNSPVTIQSLNFLNQITEVDSFTDGRFLDDTDVNEVLLWLSPFVLDHAPFLTPSTDPDNPQEGETDSYVGGRENKGANNEFELNSNAPSAHVYLRYTGAFPVSRLDEVFVVQRDRDGNEIHRFNLDTEFRSITLPDQNNVQLQYYVFDDVGATDNFSSINYLNGQTLEVVIRNTNRAFNISQNVNVLGAIKDNTIPRTKLDPQTRALIESDHSISPEETKKLEGLQLTTQSDPIPNNHEFYFKLSDFSTDFTEYHSIEQQNGILPQYERTTTYSLLIDPSITTTQLQKVEDTTQKQALQRIGNLTVRAQDGTETIYNAYTVTLPAITGANSVLDNAWQIDGTIDNSQLSGAENSFKIHMGNLDTDIINRLNGSNDPVAIPDNLIALSRDLTVGTRVESGWRSLPSPIRSNLTRQYAALWDENRRTFTGNYFDDLTPGIDIIGFASNTIFFYSDPNTAANTAFPGAQSFIENDNIRFRNASGQTGPISDNLEKIIGFDYALQRTLLDTDNADMIRMGTGSTPMIALAANEGLYLNIGRGDGSQQTRKYDVGLQVDGAQWGTRVSVTTQSQSEIIIPDSLSGSLTVKVRVQGFDNDNDEGTHEEDYTITNLDIDQSFSGRLFTFNLIGNITVTANYEHNNTDLSNPRRILKLIPPPISNAAHRYNVRASREITETWNDSTTYARRPINAGSGHDDFGLFDPRLWNTEHVNERNRVLFMVQKYRPGDTSSDPEVAVKVIVDGQREGSPSEDYVIRLHRPASDFTFNDISHGNNLCAISHIQAYDYEENLIPTMEELQTLYNTSHIFLNAFTNRTLRIDRFIFNADIEVMPQEGFIITDTTDGNRYMITSVNGILTPVQLP